MEVEMLKSRVVGCMCAVATIAGLAPTVASAQPADKTTYFTFSGPVDMPGVALPAGKYVFRLANPDTSRNVIQVASADGKRVVGLFFSHPAERRDAAKDSEIRFMEASAGTPPAIKTWWYPGERTGYEFVYPKSQARRIAQRTKQDVLTTKVESTTAQQTNTEALTRVSAAGNEIQVEGAGIAEPNPSGSAQRGEVTNGSAPTKVGTVARARTQLPQTGSNSPLVALIGVLMLAAAALIRFPSKSV
jgi:LPXTG-motif cell wall-anchored protein